jgi:hypothetical protein
VFVLRCDDDYLAADATWFYGTALRREINAATTGARSTRRGFSSRYIFSRSPAHSFCDFVRRVLGGVGIRSLDLESLPQIAQQLRELLPSSSDGIEHGVGTYIKSVIQKGFHNLGTSMRLHLNTPLHLMSEVPGLKLETTALLETVTTVADQRRLQRELGGLHSFFGNEPKRQRMASALVDVPSPGSRIPKEGSHFITRGDEVTWGTHKFSLRRLKDGWRRHTGNLPFDIGAAMTSATTEPWYRTRFSAGVKGETLARYMKYNEAEAWKDALIHQDVEE